MQKANASQSFNTKNITEQLSQVLNHMLEACMNLYCQWQGADIIYLKLHAALQQQFCYYVKHAQGVSHI